ncbi:MAG: ester cyclase [Planctomycetota bacterium]
MTTALRPPLADEARYRVDPEPIARGGMGVIWSAVDANMRRQVAVKSLRPELIGSPGAFDRFAHEVIVQARLEHPGIVPVYDSHLLDDVPCFSMKLIRGKPLSALLAAFRQQYAACAADWFHSADFNELMERFQSLCLTMESVHRQGVIHRDLKPGNVLIGELGEAFVTDWGLALADGVQPPAASHTAVDGIPGALPGERVTHTGQRLGTRGYASPEQLEGAALTPASDVYSLGVILRDIVAVPVDNDGSLTLPRELEPVCPIGILDVVAAATRPNVADRIQSAARLREALGGVIDASAAETWFVDLNRRLWDERDDSAVEEMIDEQCVFHVGQSLPPLHGREAFRQWVQMVRGAFPDLRFHHGDTLANARDSLAYRGEFSGTHLGVYLGYPPTGRSFRMSTTSFFRLRGRQAIECHGFVDLLGQLVQLGLIAPAIDVPYPGSPRSPDPG